MIRTLVADDQEPARWALRLVLEAEPDIEVVDEAVDGAEAVEKANNTPFGLSAGVWTDKGSLILHMANQLRAGVVWANTFNKFDPTSPFGGYKESGYGREGGRHGLEGYLK